MTGALGSGLPNFGEEFNKIRRNVIVRLVEERKRSREDLVLHPAVGHEVTKKERRMKYLSLMTDPLALGAALDEEADRWKLKPNVMPRNVIDFLVTEHKAFQKEKEEES